MSDSLKIRLTQALARIEELELAEIGAQEAFAQVVEDKRAAQARVKELQRTVFAQQDIIRELQAKIRVYDQRIVDLGVLSMKTAAKKEGRT
jgi:hypothetical protein